MSKSERLYVLKGFIRGDDEQVQYFTHNEKDLAIHVAKSWFARGWMPYLFSKTFDGNFKVWFDYRTAKPAKKVAIPKRKAA